MTGLYATWNPMRRSPDETARLRSPIVAFMAIRDVPCAILLEEGNLHEVYISELTDVGRHEVADVEGQP